MIVTVNFCLNNKKSAKKITITIYKKADILVAKIGTMDNELYDSMPLPNILISNMS